MTTPCFQNGLDNQRAVYEKLPKPLLNFMAEIHGLSHRQFAAIFGISKSYAEEVLNQRKFPSLELAIKIARYFEVGVEELYGWRVPDNGFRRPLVIELGGKPVRLLRTLREHNALELVLRLAQQLEGKNHEIPSTDDAVQQPDAN